MVLSGALGLEGQIEGPLCSKEQVDGLRLFRRRRIGNESGG